MIRLRSIFPDTSPSTENGFTLIEILIVMLIIAILASLSAANFQSSQLKARDSKRKSDLHQIANSLETYFNDAGSYPLSTVDGKIQGCNGGDTCDWGSPFVDDKGTTYMVKLPTDPTTQNRGYVYHYESDGTMYQLYARLENTDDIDIPKSGEGQPEVYGAVMCGGVGCNYGISSSNSSPSDNNSPTPE